MLIIISINFVQWSGGASIEVMKNIEQLDLVNKWGQLESNTAKYIAIVCEKITGECIVTRCHYCQLWMDSMIFKSDTQRAGRYLKASARDVIGQYDQRVVWLCLAFPAWRLKILNPGKICCLKDWLFSDITEKPILSKHHL